MSEKQHMSAIQHLEELRRRIIITLAFFIVFLLVAFLYVQDIYHFLVSDLPFKLALLGPTDILVVYLTIATVMAIAATLPFAASQLWLFVKPALTQKERQTALAYIPALFLLFLGGISFGYFILFPMVLKFLMSLSDDVCNFFYYRKIFPIFTSYDIAFWLLI